MKTIVISGSASLVDQVDYWINYFQERNYEVLDWPKYVGDTFTPEEYDNHKTKCYIELYKNLENVDIYFLMNVGKKGIEGYIGTNAISELTYVVVQNLIHNANKEIYILKKPSPEQGCYEEVKFWLDKGWIKLFDEKNFFIDSFRAKFKFSFCSYLFKSYNSGILS